MKVCAALGLTLWESNTEVRANEICEEGATYRRCFCSAVGHENSLDPTVEFVHSCKVEPLAETANPVERSRRACI